MTGKIFRSILLAAVIVLLASFIIIIGVMYDYSTGLQHRQLTNELEVVSTAVQSQGIEYLSTLKKSDCRITWVDSDGSVLFDNAAAETEMENHADREEIAEAFATGEGESTRYSATLTEQTFYCARLLSDGTVLRLSVSQASVLTLVMGMLQPLAFIFVAAFLLSALLAHRMSKRIVTPLNQLDLDNPLENDAYEELAPLLKRINRQQIQIRTQLRDLKQKTDEFAQITGSMCEGLILLNEKSEVVSVNPAAMAIFGIDSSCVGQDFLTVDRSPDVNQAIGEAMKNGHSELRWERSGREYQFDFSRIDSDGKAVGMVLLAFDVTERAFAERNRREFTANVSHELKTPLQTIIGSSELIENGLVKQEDMPRFIDHIHKEASRLVTLIDDVIRLSQLDEGVELPKERVDLYELAGETISTLEDSAAKKQVTLKVTGASAEISGVRRLLYEIIYNLCDNAIKYNVDGGSVEVNVTSGEDEAAVSVSDTGIGIPPEHQSRIFERFYRVDKSHSKQSGGTGLGLSIVKHAAQYHNAKLELKSREGEGTTITVRFPIRKEN